MKLLQLFILLTIFSTFTACSNDDDENCNQSDWIGTYTGTINYFTSQDSVEDVTVTVTSSGSDAIILKYETPTSENEFDPLTPQECQVISGEHVDPPDGELININASLDKVENRLFFDHKVSMGGAVIVNYHIDALQD